MDLDFAFHDEPEEPPKEKHQKKRNTQKVQYLDGCRY